MSLLARKLAELKMTEIEIANKLGVSQPYINTVMKGKVLGKNATQKFVKAFGFDYLELMNDFNKENNLITSSPTSEDKFDNMEEEEKTEIPRGKSEVSAVPFDDYMMVEYADLSAVAGKLGIENPALLPENRKKLLPKEFDKGNYLVVKVDGDSMDDGSNISIPDGTDILIKEYQLSRNEKLPIRNNLFVIVSETGTLFKQIIEHNIELGYIKCRSYNPKYKVFVIPLDLIMQIFIYRKIVSLRPSIPNF